MYSQIATDRGVKDSNRKITIKTSLLAGVAGAFCVPTFCELLNENTSLESPQLSLGYLEYDGESDSKNLSPNPKGVYDNGTKVKQEPPPRLVECGPGFLPRRKPIPLIATAD
eukprot:Trichotokara_eunicae@DN1905_c0_g1_i2.p1